MMMPSVGRCLFWLLLLVYVLVSAWWTLTVPYAPDQLLRAIPGQAISVSMHDQLAGCWSDLSDHPVAVSLAAAWGVSPEDWEATRRDPGVKYILDLVGQKDLVLAYVPYLDYQREASWVLASWVGGRSQRLRLLLPWIDIPGLERSGQMGGWPVWTYRWTTDGVQHQIYLALVEGMILGCSARNPLAMEMVIESYNGTFPSIRRRRDLQEVNQRLLQSEYPVRLWYSAIDKRGVPSYDDPWLIEFRLTEPAHVEGRIRLSTPSGLTALPVHVAIHDVVRWWGNHPIAAGMASAELLGGVPDETNSVIDNVIADVVTMSRGEAVALGMFGGDFSGRYMGIKVPTLMVGMAMAEPMDVGALARALADRWNARYRWGLVVNEHLVGTNMVYQFEGTSNFFYSKFDVSEQVALTRIGSWLMFSSNARGLGQLITTQHDAPDIKAVMWAATHEKVPDRPNWGYMGVDLVRGRETLRLAISAYALKLLFEDAESSREQRQQLNEAKAWLDILATMQYLHVLGRLDGPHIEIEFHAGP